MQDRDPIVTAVPEPRCVVTDRRQDDLDAILETLRRSTVQTIRELERRFGVAATYDVRIVRKARLN